MARKILYGFLATLFLAIIGLVAVPFVFKDQLKARLLQELDTFVDAEVHFSDIHFSSFQRFPHLTISLSDFSLAGHGTFKEDTLVRAKKLKLSFDLYTVVKGENMELKSIYLEQPVIKILVLEDGRANYEIALPTDTTDKVPDTSSFDLNINHWEMKDGKLKYHDKQQGFLLELAGVSHKGTGDFKKDLTDISTSTSAEALSIKANGLTYLNKKSFTADLVMEANLKDNIFTFKDHLFRINHFAFGFEGFFKLLPQGYETDLRFAVKETNFKNVLSLFPGIYLKDLEHIQTSGDFTCEGFLKGRYEQSKDMYPQFGFQCHVKDGMFRYDHLPQAVQNIQFDMVVENKTSSLENLFVHIKKFHLDMGQNPVHGFVKMEGLNNREIHADIKAQLNLTDMEKMYPMDSLVLKGLLALDLKIDGIWKDSSSFPNIQAKIQLDSGFINHLAFPAPMEHIQISAEALNQTGQLEDTKIRVNRMTYTFEDEPFEMSGSLANPLDYAFDLRAKGVLDLEKLSQIYTLEGVRWKGLVDVDLETQGKKSDLDAKKWNMLKSKGSVQIRDMRYSDQKLTQDFHITDAYLVFSPEKLILERFKGAWGKSSIRLTGHLFDYLAFTLDPNQALKGDLQMDCDTLDLNDWKNTNTDTSKATLQVVQIPKNIDFIFDSKIKCVRLGTLNIQDLDGEIRLKDGILSLNETGFSAVDAKFAINGTYDAGNVQKPMFDLKITLDKLDLNKAYTAYTMAQTNTTTTSDTYGICSGSYKLKGELAPDFQPIVQTLTGAGTIQIEQAEVKGMKLFHHISNLTKKEEMTNPSIKGVVMETEIKGGKLHIKPFSFQLGRYLTEIAGSHSFDNQMDYVLKISVPPLNKLKIPIHIKGTTDKPIIKLGKGHEHFDFNTL